MSWEIRENIKFSKGGYQDLNPRLTNYSVFYYDNFFALFNEKELAEQYVEIMKKEIVEADFDYMKPFIDNGGNQ